MDEDIDGINVVPLVDVMLVLLTIVLTTATFIVTGRIPVDLAEARHAGSALERPVVVTLTLHKAIYVNERPVNDLAAALAPVGRATPIVVRADGGLELRAFVELADRIKGMGFDQVALEVRRL
ncbi:biopolymer transport protein ExbD [Sulfuritortus calidifontis]|uniref:Biopolymer transport protein ExbD n=1 Tax=Sulfuritortus calidifontis TaxID=1914471 RepID=A0A4R3K069_9PROT|nr:biopolymer transporter ExbD [Sulfuritortus calidifontis]TCS73251.1 biopolymer transport protein ExbD [Sulfuritortus calidifontis]